MHRRKTILIGGTLFTAMLVAIIVGCGASSPEEPAETAPAAAQPVESSPTTAPAEATPTTEPAASAVEGGDSSAEAASTAPQQVSTPGEPLYRAPVDSAFVTRVVDSRGKEYRILTSLGKDAIPSIDDPSFISVQEAVGQVSDQDIVIGLSINGDHRAYSVPFLSSHEIVNDVVGGKPVAVTW